MSDYIGVLDIGSGFFKAVVFYIDENIYDEEGAVAEDFLAKLKKPSKGIERGNIVRASAAKSAVREVLKLLSDTSNADFKELYILLTHPKIKFTNIKVELDLKEESPLAGEEGDGLVQVEEKHLQRLKELVKNQANEAGYEIIHIVPRYFVLDGEKNYEPVGLHASKIEGYYHVIKLKKQVYLNMKNLLRALGYDVKRLMFPAFVASYDVLNDEDTKKKVLIIDLGHTTSGFSYFTEGSPQISGALDIGLRDIAEAFALSYNIPVKTVQQLFQEVGYYKKTALPSEGEEDEVIEVPVDEGETVTLSKAEIGVALREAISQILVDILNRLSEEGVDIVNELDEIVLVGGGSNIKNIKELFEELLQGDINCRIRIGKRKELSYYGQEEVNDESFISGDFAPVRGAVNLIKSLKAQGLMENGGGSNPFTLTEKRENASFEEADTILAPLSEPPKKKGNFFSKIVAFFKNLFSED